VTAQVLNHLAGVHGVTRDGVAGFFATEFGALEEYEVDLLLASLFTPTLEDQARVADSLGAAAVPEAEWPALIQLLLTRPTRARLSPPEGGDLRVALPEVIIERFVRRLRLDATIPEDVTRCIERIAAPGHRSLGQAMARRAIWGTPGRREILIRFLDPVTGAGLPADGPALLQLMETYAPADRAELRGQIPHWQRVLRQQINAAGAKPFFNERVEELHGGGRDQRQGDPVQQTARENELEFLDRLAAMLAD
jgi:hypothetical protein